MLLPNKRALPAECPLRSLCHAYDLLQCLCTHQQTSKPHGGHQCSAKNKLKRVLTVYMRSKKGCPQLIEGALDSGALSNSTADNIFEKIGIIPIEHSSSLFATFGSFQNQVLVNVITDKDDREEVSSPALELSLQFSRRL